MPFSPRKIKLLFILTTLLWTEFTPDSFSQEKEKATYQGFFPVPFVSLDQFMLQPRTAASMAACEMGTIFIDQANFELTVCGQSNFLSKKIWTQYDFPIGAQTHSYVYPTDLTTEKVIIGNDATSLPPSEFNVLGTPVALRQNAFNIDPINGPIHSTGMTLKMDGPALAGPGPFPPRTTDIQFHVGNRGQDFDGRILYMNLPTQGFAFFGGFKALPDMWIDTLDHQIGIGTVTPTERLEIIGQIETNKIILDQDGTLGPNPPSDLKFSYSPVAGSEGYYAVYAP